MTGTNITTVSTIGISLSSTAANPVNIASTGGFSVTSGLYALACDSTGFVVPGAFTITNYGAVIDTAPNSFGITMNGGGQITDSVFALSYLQSTISGSAAGIAISGGSGVVNNRAGRIQATATSGVGISLAAGGSVYNGLFHITRPAIYGVITGGASAAAVNITGGAGYVYNRAATIGAGAGTGVYLGAGGTVKNAIGTVGIPGTINGTQSGIVGKGGATTVINYGVIIGGTNAVSLPAGFANLLKVSGGVSFSGAVDGGNAVGAPVGSTLELAGAGTTLAGLGGTITNFSTVLSDFNATWFLTGNSAGLAGGEIFENFAVGDTINVTGITNETIAGFSNNTLTLGGGTLLNLTISAPGATAANFAVSNDAINGIDITSNLASQACFAEGTRILTDQGEVAVEHLREGDRVVTLDGIAPVVWIGHRRVRPGQHPRPETVRPVVIQPDTFGPGQPHRALRLSPDHAVFVDDVLIPIGVLINSTSIVQEDVGEVTYYHVRLPEHDVLFTEGLSCESYLATGDDTAFDNNGGAVSLHPSFAPAAIWETMGCAPLVKSGARLDAVRARLGDRAGRHTRAA